MLYNFHDTPQDLFERMRLNVALNEELGVRIFSFPMRYQPTDLPNRSHVGEHWNRYFLRSIQTILQATQGIVSGSPDFFKRAFGDTYEDFESILMRPHHFIFNRDWYEHLGGRQELDEYGAALARLSESQRRELLELLSSSPASEYKRVVRGRMDPLIKAAFQFYLPPSKEREHAIWAKVAKLRQRLEDEASVAEDERVEDAGLYDDATPEQSQLQGVG